MTELQELAREVLKYYDNLPQEYGISPHDDNVIELAQKVIDSDAVKCSFNYTKDELQDLSNGVLSAVEQARQE